ncbi:MAG: ClpXP protease specificity-enhancing factor [Giesbergeria sp.]|uniref:ClpXP protease specificity-enhancing factor n=1 Tax=Giesbergeria sp. TaxID=2818473 RepID=UPI0026034E8D|nr:ClpXP protease specificity-enhancing factor [Giesbergeria sp.]MDD2608724.1 ClpXP protease specificity-enhancing factor [Giesbergeria sp.]
MNAQEPTTTRPYLIRALHEWCIDNGFTPYIAVRVDSSVQVPREFVKDGEIVLNVGLDATSGLLLGNDYIEFKARFAGKVRDIMVPVGRIVAIYARENGQGMAFPPPDDDLDVSQNTEALFSLSEQPSEAQLAGHESSTADRASIHLVPSDSAIHASDEPEPPPPRPPAGAGGRPALKRVK